jgi:hypothetical protein
MALFVTACGTAGPQAATSDAPRSVVPIPAPTAAATASPADVLDEIVIAKSGAPADTTFLQSLSGAASGTQMVQDSASAVQSKVLEGFVDGLTREFASPETAAVILGSATPDGLDPADLHFVGSIALAYRTPELAGAALDVFAQTIRADSGLSKEERLELGDGGTVFRGTFLGARSEHYLWRHGSLVLGLAADGMGEVDTLAKGMESRAPVGSVGS